MHVVRFSAVEMFGAPLDNAKDVGSYIQLVQLMLAYSIEGKEVTTEPTDITPYYWQRPAFRYFLTRREPDGPALVEMLPQHNDSIATVVTGSESGTPKREVTTDRTVVIPGDQPGIAIIGPGPRHVGKMCVHELVVHIPNEIFLD